MNASKENARKAYKQLTQLLEIHADTTSDLGRMIQYFLVAAERKLPSEKSFKKPKGNVDRSIPKYSGPNLA